MMGGVQFGQDRYEKISGQVTGMNEYYIMRANWKELSFFPGTRDFREG